MIITNSFKGWLLGDKFAVSYRFVTVAMLHKELNLGVDESRITATIIQSESGQILSL